MEIAEHAFALAFRMMPFRCLANGTYQGTSHVPHLQEEIHDLQLRGERAMIKDRALDHSREIQTWPLNDLHSILHGRKFLGHNTCNVLGKMPKPGRISANP
jgi:hypothetical protein